MKHLVWIIPTVGTGIITVVGFIARSVFLHYLDADLEKHKANLKRDADRAIEQLKSDLRIKQIEHDVRFRRADEIVATHIAEVYSRLHVCYQGVTNLVAELRYDGKPLAEAYDDVAAAFTRFNDYFYLNRPYIPESLDHRVHELGKKLGGIAIDFKRTVMRPDYVPPEGEDPWEDANDALRRDADSLFADLRTACRQLLGVDCLTEE